MTDIKILSDRIIFDGHSDSRQECETITLMCDNLAKSKDFKTVKYEKGYAEFEKIGNVEGVKDLMFAPALYNLTINFDSNITQVVIDAEGGIVTCTESGSSYDNMTYKFDHSTALPFTVTLNNGYVLDNVTVTDNGGGSVTITSGNTFTGNYICGDSDCTITITSKKAAVKQKIDISTLSGWTDLSSGDHSVSVKTTARGYLDSASSNAVTVNKAAGGYTITPTLTNVTGASGNATSISSGETKMLTFTAEDGYTLPDTVSVTGATGSWDKASGTLTLSNAIGNITFAITGLPLSLIAPVISLIGDNTIQIDTIDSRVENIQVFYRTAGALHVIGIVKKQSGDTKQIIDLTTLSGWGNVPEGAYLFGIQTIASGYSSVVSNDINVTIPYYTITVNATNVKTSGNNPTTIRQDGKNQKTLGFTPAEDYVLPDTVTVIGAEYTWAKLTGTLVLKNPTSNIAVTIDGVKVASTTYTINVTNTGNFDISFYQNSSILATIGSSGGNFEAEAGTVTSNTDALYMNKNTVVTGGVAVDSVTSTSPTFTITGAGTITVDPWCLIEGTQITLADGTTKAIEDITYDDELLVWNFYAGRFDKAKPKWIKVAEVAPRYNLVKFSNGSEVGFVGAGGEKGYHRIFNKEAGAFTHTGCKDTPNGTTTFAQDETFPTVISQEVIEKEVKFYNVITDKHYNLFANGILTSCKLSNKYHIENMRYIGEKLISDEQEKAYFERIENKRK